MTCRMRLDEIWMDDQKDQIVEVSIRQQADLALSNFIKGRLAALLSMPYARRVDDP